MAVLDVVDTDDRNAIRFVLTGLHDAIGYTPFVDKCAEWLVAPPGGQIR
jgi:hypothetical protein